MKKLIKPTFYILIVLFIILFLNRNNDYVSDTTLSQESIIKFEEDLKAGKEIVPSNYITPKKDYKNKANEIGMKCSNLIEKAVNKVLKRLIESIDN